VSKPLKGLVLGVVVALVFVAVTTPVARGDSGIWWWPAGLVAGAIGGAVLGALFGVESEGELPEEAYGPTTAGSSSADHSTSAKRSP
jgi:hypothetical protein